MSKDFSQFLNDEKNKFDYQPKVQSQDPNLFTNESQQQEIFQNSLKSFLLNSISTIALNFLVAPLTTIHVSLQLSVMPHMNKYGDVNQEEQLKALIKTTKEITPQEKRKYELLIKSGLTGNNRPFRAPVYSGYFEIVRALANQGVLGFFKGFWTGCQYAIANSYLRFMAISLMDYQWAGFWHQGNQLFRQGIMFLTVTSFDMLLNPLMLTQSRFILQNRLPNFLIYKNSAALFRKHFLLNPLEVYRGTTGHIYKNMFIFTGSLFGILFGNEKSQLLVNTASGIILGYPWLTVIRRLQCQTKRLPGMIPIRYSGPIHCLRLIIQEEGIKGLYKGFTAYLIANSFLSYLMFFNQLQGVDDIQF